MILKNVPKTDPMFQKIWRMTLWGLASRQEGVYARNVPEAYCVEDRES